MDTGKRKRFHQQAQRAGRGEVISKMESDDHVS